MHYIGAGECVFIYCVEISSFTAEIDKVTAEKVHTTVEMVTP